MERNEFSVKAMISRAPLDQRFLLYIPSAKPPEPDNWLLDLLLAGHEFTADRASLDIQEAGLTLEFKELAQQHKAFFRSPVRTTKLKELLRPNDVASATGEPPACLYKKNSTCAMCMRHSPPRGSSACLW